MTRAIAILLLCASTAFAGMPALRSAKVTINPYVLPFGCSNGVFCLYKATSLGTVFSPFKPAAYWPVSRTNITVPVLAGQKFQFRCTVQAQPLGESDPSNTVTWTAPQ